MQDEQLSELERRWRSTGQIELEIELLRACLRSGRLTRERLEVAAWAGHAAARSLVSDDVPAPPHPWARWASHHSWLDGLKDEEAMLRAGLAATHSCWSAWIPRLGSSDRVIDDGLAAVEDGLISDGDLFERLEPLSEAIQELGTADILERPGSGYFVDGYFCLLRTAMLLIARRAKPKPMGELIEWVRNQGADRVPSGLFSPQQPITGLGLMINNAAHHPTGKDRGAAQEAVVNEIIPWALGRSDPVRMRVARRRKTAGGQD